MKYTVGLFGFVIIFAGLLRVTVAQTVDCALATDTMYKAPNSRAVYYITTDCKKQLVKNPDAYFSYAISWSEVRGANAAILAAIPDHALRIAPWGPRRNFLGGTLVKSPNDPRIFLVSKYSANGQSLINTLIPFDSERAFLENGYQWSWVEDVAQSVISNTPISGYKITANWDYFPAGVLYKHSESSALYLTRIGGGLVPSRAYVGSLDDLKNLGYRYDHVPNFPAWFPLSETGSTGNVTNNNGTPAPQTGPQDSALCNDTNTTQSGSIMLCQGTTVRINPYVSMRLSVLTASEVVVSIIKNGGSTQAWTVPLGQSKSGVFFEDPDNTFTLWYDQYAFSTVKNKGVAYLRLNTTATSANTNNQNNSNTNNVTVNCQSYTGQDSAYKVCTNNTIYHSGNNVTFRVVSYTDDWLTISYTAPRPGLVTETGTMTIRAWESGYLELPWSYRRMQIGYLGKVNGLANVSLYTTYNYAASTFCSGSQTGGDGNYTLCLGQQLTHTSQASFKLKSVSLNTARLEINNVWETQGSSDPYVWNVGPGQTIGFRVIKTGGTIGEYLDLDILSVGSDYVSFRIRNT